MRKILMCHSKKMVIFGKPLLRFTREQRHAGRNATYSSCSATVLTIHFGGMPMEDLGANCGTHSESPAATNAGDNRTAEPAPRNVRVEVLQAVEVATRAAPSPHQALFPKDDKNARQLREGPGELLESLTSHFTQEELLESRVVERVGLNDIRLSPILGETAAKEGDTSAQFGAAKSFFILSRDADGLPVNATSARGSLSAEPSWFRFAAKIVHGEEVPQEPMLLATTDVELHWFYRLKLRATPAVGLKALTGQQVKWLFDHRHHLPAGCKFQLILPYWNIAAFQETPSQESRQILNHLLDMPRLYNVDAGQIFKVWLPTAEEMVGCSRALRFSDKDRLAAQLSASLAKSCHVPTDAATIIRDRKPVDFDTARLQLLKVIKRSEKVPLASEAAMGLEKLEQAFRVHVSSLLPASTSKDGWARLAAMMAIDVAEQWCESLDVVHAARKVKAGEHPGAGCFDTARLDQQLKFVNAFTKLNRLRKSG
ncbi:MAG: hypothetical protein ABIU95_04975 [Burkholderiales bacterium]